MTETTTTTSEEVDLAEDAKTEAPKARTSEVAPTDGDRTEPKAGSKKDIVFQAGRTEEGGSISELAAKMGTTQSNIRQHVVQCNTKLGFGYRIEGDRFWVTGDATITAAEIQARKDEEAKKKAEAKAEAEKKANEPNASAPQGDAAEGLESSDEDTTPDTTGDDDFLN